MANVAILGSGDVGKSLARGFSKKSYRVIVGTDHPEKLSGFKSENPQIDVKSFEDAAKLGEIVVLSVKGTAAQKIVEKVKDDLSGKVVIDTTNPLADAPPQDGVLSFFTDTNSSLMEMLQKVAPDARFVKAFNTIGNADMVDPKFESRPTMFICGNDSAAKEQVSEILVKFGFEPEDMGTAKSARAIEPLCVLWCLPGFLKNDWSHAFKLLKK